MAAAGRWQGPSHRQLGPARLAGPRAARDRCGCWVAAGSAAYFTRGGRQSSRPLPWCQSGRPPCDSTVGRAGNAAWDGRLFGTQGLTILGYASRVGRVVGKRNLGPVNGMHLDRSVGLLGAFPRDLGCLEARIGEGGGAVIAPRQLAGRLLGAVGGLDAIGVRGAASFWARARLVGMVAGKDPSIGSLRLMGPR